MLAIGDNEKITFDALDQSGRIEFGFSNRSLSRILLLPPTLDWDWCWPFTHNNNMWLSLLLLLLVLVLGMFFGFTLSISISWGATKSTKAD